MAKVMDSNIEHFLQPDFEPSDYLNTKLPSLSTSTSSNASRSVPLPELSNQLQTLLSQLNAQTSRVSNSLTQLTDEIVRSGGRLAYEVEVLRGETNGLTDCLQSKLKGDIGAFVPGASLPAVSESTTNGHTAHEDEPTDIDDSHEPDHLERLRTLTSVRERLDSVIKVFGNAMEWPIAPSDLSMTSSIISVSAPDAEDAKRREEKGKAFAEKLRTEIVDMIGSRSDKSDLEAANDRVDELRRLAEVWRGTSEDKARLKFVEGLQKLVEDKQKALGRAGVQRSTTLPTRGTDYRYGDLSSTRPPTEGGYGFLQNLRNLKNDVYLD